MTEIRQTRELKTHDDHILAHLQFMADTARSKPAKDWYTMLVKQKRRRMSASHYRRYPKKTMNKEYKKEKDR